MGILIGGGSRVLVQGITGREGSFHTARMIAAGTVVVAGTSPGKGGQAVAGVPVFDDCAAAVAATRADVSVVFVPAPAAALAVDEAAGAGIRLVVCVTEGIPVHDTMRMVADLEARGVRLIGPNCPGIVTVGDGLPPGADPRGANVGIMPDGIFCAGPVGVISRSGTLTYQIVSELTQAGLGQTTVIGMGGDPVHGVGFSESLELFAADEATEVVVLVGEIGGDDEERAAELARERLAKPLVAYVAGFTAPPGKTMGHAGAIVSGGKGTAAAKAEALAAAGVPVARRPDEVPALVRAALAAGTAGSRS